MYNIMLSVISGSISCFTFYYIILNAPSLISALSAISNGQYLGLAQLLWGNNNYEYYYSSDVNNHV